MKTEEITITPTMAQKMLDTMGPNRNIRHQRVHQIANDIKNGDFKESNDLISFDNEGHLINGQHRLNAVLEANMPITVWIAYDVDKKTVIDRGASRNTLDTGIMQGLLSGEIANSKCVSIANTYLNIKYGSETRNYSDSMKIKFINQYESEIVLAYRIGTTGVSHSLCAKAPVEAAFLGAILNEVDSTLLFQFSERVATGVVFGKEETAAGVLHRYLESLRGKGQMFLNDQASITEQALQDYINGKPRKKAYIAGPHPYIKPEKGDKS